MIIPGLMKSVLIVNQSETGKYVEKRLVEKYEEDMFSRIKWRSFEAFISFKAYVGKRRKILGYF